jgi:ABC-type glutathione transport system ATPase component
METRSEGGPEARRGSPDPKADAKPVGVGTIGRGPVSGPVVFVAERVSKSFAGVTALRDVDFDLRRGEVHALMGENGAGKSTLMKILAGVHTRYDGIIRLDGQSAAFGGVRDAEGAGVAIIHQELNLVPELSVADNIFLGREPLIAGALIDERRMVRAAERLLRRLGVNIDPRSRVAELRIGSNWSRSPRRCRSTPVSSSWTSRLRHCRRRNARRCSRSYGSSLATGSRSSILRTASRRFSTSPIG